jgi:hypothetical protein
MTTPLIHLAGDKPRARLTDPPQSHQAADASSYRRKRVLLAVLEIIATDGEMTGSEVNDDYRSWSVVARPEFPRCHPDTPRKRAGEAAEDGLLDVVSHKKGVYGVPEAVYRISPEGRRLLEAFNRPPFDRTADELFADEDADAARVALGLAPLHVQVVS